MGRICLVCNSSHRQEYDNMRLEGKSVKDVYYFATNMYHENLRYYHFQKHFQNHLGVIDKKGESRNLVFENLGRLFLDKLKDAKRIEIEV
jgi:hypothetical protein